MNTMLQIIKLWSMLALMGCCLNACDPKIAEHGRKDLLTRAGNITPSQSTEHDVLQLLGSPAATSQFGEKTWYYFSSRNESVAFLPPEVVKQEVLRITFDNGIVKELEHYSEKEAQNVAFSSRQTPTAGQKYGFFEQLLGNIGRFNKQQDSMAQPGARGG